MTCTYCPAKLPKKGYRRCPDFERFCGETCYRLHMAIMHPRAWPLRDPR